MPAGPAEQDRRQWLVDCKSGGVLGALALLLASIGVHGVVSYGVSQRTRETGMDMTRSPLRLSVCRYFCWAWRFLASYIPARRAVRLDPVVPRKSPKRLDRRTWRGYKDTPVV